MSEARNGKCIMTSENLHRYVWNEMEESERSSTEEHIKGCESCQETIAFMRQFGAATEGLLLDRDESNGECPTTEQLALLEEDVVSGDDARRLREHTVRCRDCSKKFLMLRGMRFAEDAALDVDELPEKVASQHPHWKEYYERARKYLIDLSHRYSPGSLLGPIRIAQFNAQPALRGEHVAAGRTMLLEVPVGPNVYGVAITFTATAIVIDVAGYIWMEKSPVTVTVFGASGAMMDSTRTDVYGNARLELRLAGTGTDRIVVTISLNDGAWESFSIDQGG